MLECEQRGSCACRDTKFVVNVLDMVVDRAFGQDQRRGNLAVAAAARKQPEHLELTLTQAADAVGSARVVTSYCENRRGSIVVDAAAANLAQ